MTAGGFGKRSDFHRRKSASREERFDVPKDFVFPVGKAGEFSVEEGVFAHVVGPYVSKRRFSGRGFSDSHQAFEGNLHHRPDAFEGFRHSARRPREAVVRARDQIVFGKKDAEFFQMAFFGDSRSAKRRVRHVRRNGVYAPIISKNRVFLIFSSHFTFLRTIRVSRGAVRSRASTFRFSFFFPPMPQAAKISVGLHVFLVDREAGKVLLLKRANTGRYDGRWSVPAGRLDVGESFSQ